MASQPVTPGTLLSWCVGARVWPLQRWQKMIFRCSGHLRTSVASDSGQSCGMFPATGCWGEMRRESLGIRTATGQRPICRTQKALSVGEGAVWRKPHIALLILKKFLRCVHLLGPWHCCRLERTSRNFTSAPLANPGMLFQSLFLYFSVELKPWLKCRPIPLQEKNASYHILTPYEGNWDKLNMYWLSQDNLRFLHPLQLPEIILQWLSLLVIENAQLQKKLHVNMILSVQEGHHIQECRDSIKYPLFGLIIQKDQETLSLVK